MSPPRMPKPTTSAVSVPAIRAQLTFNDLKTLVFAYIVATHCLKSYRHLRARGLIATCLEIWELISKRVLTLVLRLPAARRKVETEMAKAKHDIETKLVASGPNVVRYLSLPIQGRSPEWIDTAMAKMDEECGGGDKWKQGKLSGAVYHGGEDMEEVIVNAFKRYVVSNPLHPDVFPAIRKMEAEVVAMCLRMYNHPNGAGATTSGGTESILMSCKTHREWARDVKGITEPEMIIPVTAHAAFDKAGEYFGIKIHHIPVDPQTRQVDIKHVRRAINSNTIMLVGSAVNFPDGCMDDIEALGALAKKYNIDSDPADLQCLGSFIVPFLEKLGYDAPRFDFRVQGVTAISCDTHKYGFAPKGSSVIMYRSADLRRYQYYLNPTWTGGVYASPSMSGSRPGSLIAGAWAAMQYMGQSGYEASCREIVECRKKIEKAIREDIPELRVLGKPVASVVAFAAADKPLGDNLNVLEVGDAMSRRGWHLNALSNPAAVHIACTRLTVPMADQFIADLKDCVAEAKGKPAGKGSMVALYGLGNSSAVGPALVSRLATMFLDTLYKA
ncbi:Sphinganine-1-phosphate aldolase [Ceratobasidium theobromae]|uniref:sphinganine-1-phosphate aldolase n=1 Tax=Ceratobasidium theobromae TaxID=1582974 RepID=A0A5N5QXY6_9AGAM|nr:Sphinganine-1-phosphate aldolase [Ceratobasidium theobromae]